MHYFLLVHKAQQQARAMIAKRDKVSIADVITPVSVVVSRDKDEKGGVSSVEEDAKKRGIEVVG